MAAAVAAPSKPAPTVDAVVFKVIGALALACGFFVGGAFAFTDRTEATVDKAIKVHAEHPHDGVATAKDVARLEAQNDKLDEKLDKVLERLAP